MSGGSNDIVGRAVEEEELASALTAVRTTKPVFVLIAGAQAKEGVTMGHAGALVHGAHGSVSSKTASLARAGAMVFQTMSDLVAKVDAVFSAQVSVF
jgi:succinyl-CoA synthetase alpha subunit